MTPMYIALTTALTLACLLLITSILLQKKRDAGFSGQMTGQQAGGDTSHFDKTKARTRDGKLEKYTKILAVLFMVVSLVISLWPTS